MVFPALPNCQWQLGIPGEGHRIVERADTAARDADGLAAHPDDTQRRLTVDVLRIKQEYRRSQLDLAKAKDDRKVTAESLGRYEELVQAIAPRRT